MSRIFFALSIFAVLLLATNILLGLRIGDLNGAVQRYHTQREQLDSRGQSGKSSAAELKEAEDRFQQLGDDVVTLRERYVLHFLFGLLASLVAILVNSITVTYFIGTGRWCREVVETYGLDEEFIQRSNRLKRRTFPWALGGILIVLAIIFLGGAAYPMGINVGRSQPWVLVHYFGAVVGTGLIAWSLLAQVRNIAANYEIINEIVAQVQRIRAEKGLDADDVA